MSAPTKGRIVHFVGSESLHQAGIIVKVCGDGPSACVNLVVFRDGTNDCDPALNDQTVLEAWKTSVVRSSDDQSRSFSWHYANECKAGI